MGGSDHLRLDERHAPHASGITTALILAHVESCGGEDAVRDVLERIGKADREAALRDERTWWSWDTKIALFEAAADVVGDPEVTRTAGSKALEANVGAPLKAALRALGSPSLVYGNIVRANHKFSTSSRMVLDEISVNRALIRYELVEDVRPSRLDCLYNQGLLSCVPVLFDLPPARIEHPVCALHGGAECVYDVTWEPQVRAGWRAMTATAAGAAALTAAAAALAPAAVPAVAGVGAAAAAWWAARRRQALVDAVRHLERRMDLQAERTARVRASLHALSSALEHDEVIEQICEHGSTALGGHDTVLLLERPDGSIEAQPHPLVGEGVRAALEDWAAAVGPPTGAVELADLSAVPGLAGLTEAKPPVASLCAAPMRARGERLGLLVALAARAHSFLPQDLAVLQLFAEQASVTLSNARLYAAQQRMATRDPLTGLRNHREFHEALAAELARSRRNAARFSVALLDLDGFKAVNDRSGHAAGDEVLGAIAAALEGAGRAGDVVFRVGGDEFAVLLPDSGADEARVAAARIARAGAAVDERVGVSFGLATWPADGQDKGALLARADARLYEMKRTRPGRRRRLSRSRPRRRLTRLRGR